MWTNLCRFALAVVFVFSGFVKANDPYGTVYKVEDYLLAFGWSDYFPSFVPFFVAALLAVLEFTLGAYLFFGIRKKLTAIAVSVVMLAMTPFTLYLALANPVADCGCFGDAWVLTNWETFWKNVVLLVFALWLYAHNQLVIKFISKKNQWIISMYAIVYAMAVIYYCIARLPIFDFRPYYVGANIPAQMTVPEGETPPVYDTSFIMEKDGVRKEFTLDNYPDSTWTFVDSKTYVKVPGYVPPITDFSLRDPQTDEDVTERILQDSTYTFLLVAPYLGTADDGSIDLINEIYDYCVENQYLFYCVTFSMEDERMEWLDRTGGEYPFLLADDVVLKTIVRSNPGLVLLKNGTIVNKWSNQELPDEYVLSGRLENLPLGRVQTWELQHRILGVVLGFVGPLFFFAMLDNLYEWRKYRKRHKRNNSIT